MGACQSDTLEETGAVSKSRLMSSDRKGLIASVTKKRSYEIFSLSKAVESICDVTKSAERKGPAVCVGDSCGLSLI